MSSLCISLVIVSMLLWINPKHILHINPYAKAAEAQFEVLSKLYAWGGGDGASLHLGVFFFLTYSRANFSDKSGTRLCACQWIFNRCERSRAMRQNIGIYTFTSFFPMPFLCAFRNKPVSSLWEPSQKILAVTLRWDPPLNSWQEMTFAHRRQHARTLTLVETQGVVFFFFKLSILIEWEEGDILLYVHLSNSLITWDYEGLTATSNWGSAYLHYKWVT